MMGKARGGGFDEESGREVNGLRTLRREDSATYLLTRASKYLSDRLNNDIRYTNAFEYE